MEAPYRDLLAEARGLLDGEIDGIANAANLSALIWQRMSALNWAGFYFRKGEDLVLGPFQGKIACTRIKPGHGVCGAAVQSGKTQIVADVHAFAGHIACDAASNSELAVPLRKNGRIVGVLDLDSPKIARFGTDEARCAEGLADVWVAASAL